MTVIDNTPLVEEGLGNAMEFPQDEMAGSSRPLVELVVEDSHEQTVQEISVDEAIHPNEVENQMLIEAGQKANKPVELEQLPGSQANSTFASESLLGSDNDKHSKGKQKKPEKISFWSRLFQRNHRDHSIIKPGAPDSPNQANPDNSIQTGVSGLTQDDPDDPTNKPLASELPYSLEEIRAIVKTELINLKAEISLLEEKELIDLQQTNDSGLIDKFDQFQHSLYLVKLEALQTEVDGIIKEQNTRVLSDYDRPLRDRAEDLDFIRERLSIAEKAASEIKAMILKRVSDTTEKKDYLNHPDSINDIKIALRQQKESLVSLEDAVKKLQNNESRLPAVIAKHKAGIPLWQFGILIVTIAAAGVAGILLPKETNSKNDVSFMVEAATLYQASGETEDAVRLLDNAVNTGSKDPEVLARIGEGYRALKEYDKAAQVLSQVIAVSPNNISALLNLARSYAGLGKHQEAIAQYEKLIMLDNKNSTYFLEMGHRYRSLGNLDEALIDYQKASEINPKGMLSYYYQGEVLRAQNKFDEAIQRYQVALDTSPGNYQPLLGMGLSYFAKKDYAHAIAQYTAVIDTDPDRPEPFLYMGDAYLKMGEYDKAIDAYQQTIVLNSKSVSAYVGLGNVYSVRGDCVEAFKQFSTALKLSPQNLDAQNGISACTAGPTAAPTPTTKPTLSASPTPFVSPTPAVTPTSPAK